MFELIIKKHPIRKSVYGEVVIDGVTHQFCKYSDQNTYTFQKSRQQPFDYKDDITLIQEFTRLFPISRIINNNETKLAFKDVPPGKQFIHKDGQTYIKLDTDIQQIQTLATVVCTHGNDIGKPGLIYDNDKIQEIL